MDIEVSVLDGHDLSLFFFSSRRRHTRSLRDWSSDVCSSDLWPLRRAAGYRRGRAVLARRGGSASCTRGPGHRRIDRASASRARAVKLVLASNNPGKLREIGALLAPLSIELMPQAQLGIGEADEPHATFLENALAKARHASRAAGLPALADDSGLCVDAL